jgi:hypothetical protein
VNQVKAYGGGWTIEMTLRRTSLRSGGMDLGIDLSVGMWLTNLLEK